MAVAPMKSVVKDRDIMFAGVLRQKMRRKSGRWLDALNALFGGGLRGAVSEHLDDTWDAVPS